MRLSLCDRGRRRRNRERPRQAHRADSGDAGPARLIWRNRSSGTKADRQAPGRGRISPFWASRKTPSSASFTSMRRFPSPLFTSFPRSSGIRTRPAPCRPSKWKINRPRTLPGGIPPPIPRFSGPIAGRAFWLTGLGVNPIIPLLHLPKIRSRNSGSTNSNANPRISPS